jgi:PDZ domain/Aspartyl protease
MAIQRFRFVVELAIVAFTISAINASAGDSLPFRFTTGKSATNIPFELNSNKIYLSCKINNGDSRWFVLDSGCPVTAIEMTLARELKLPISKEQEIGGAGEGRTTLGFTQVKSLTLPGLDLFPKSTWALAVNKPVSPYEGRRIDGLLGVDFLERFVVRIDYPGRTLDVFLPGEFRPTGKEITVPLEKVGGHYTVPGTLGLKGGKSVKGRFIVDVGVRLPLLAATPFVNRHELIGALSAGPRQTVGGGLGGETTAHLGRLESLSIGDLKIDAPFVALSQEQRSFLAGDDTQGLLGAEIFRRYRMTWNLPGKQVLFEETTESRLPFEFDMSGMFLVTSVDDFHDVRVLSVVDGGPASKAGIMPNDVLLSVDGVATKDLTLEQIRSQFKEDKASRILTLIRNGEQLRVKLVLRRLV